MSGASFFRDSGRLFALITTILACVVLLGYLGTLLFRKLRDSRAIYAREISAAERVESLGAKVHWDGDTVRGVYVKRGNFPSDMADALSGLSDLQVIDQLVEVPSDAAIAKLRNLRHLSVICLSGPGIRDATIACLKDVKGLQHLTLQDAAITDVGLSHFVDFASLEYLKIDGGSITDTGVGHLKALRNLKGLDLRHISVTDAGLASLESLKTLKTLRLYGCKQITAHGVQTLQRALPNTKIGWDKSAIPGDLF
ncbi:MAG: hypothetical protein WCB27_16895 [Thermoguttaceae bacterium]